MATQNAIIKFCCLQRTGRIQYNKLSKYLRDSYSNKKIHFYLFPAIIYRKKRMVFKLPARFSLTVFFFFIFLHLCNWHPINFKTIKNPSNNWAKMKVEKKRPTKNSSYLEINKFHLPAFLCLTAPICYECMDGKYLPKWPMNPSSSRCC